MSAWAEAVYVIKEMRQAIISEELLQQLKNRRNIFAEADRDGDNYFPKDHAEDTFMNEDIWFVTDDEESENDYILTVIDTPIVEEGGNIKPSHEGAKDSYLINSVWLIQDGS